MKAQKKNVKMFAVLVLMCIFALSVSGQATGPPDCDSLQSLDNITSLTKGPNKTKNCIELKLCPNPIRNSATLEFDLSERSMVQIAIYDKQGNMVMDVVRQKFDKGHNKVTFSPSSLPTDTYYLCLFTGKKKGMRRCVII